MAKTTKFAAALLELILNNVPLAGIGDATGLRGSSADGSLYVALHTADPGEAGNQSTNEISYTGYARIAVARNPSSKKWTVTEDAGDSRGEAVNVDAILFGEMTGGTGGTATHFSVGEDPSGAGDILYKGALTPNIAVATAVQPRIPAGDALITED